MEFTEKERCYITFPAFTGVIRAEQHLLAFGIRFWLVPIPREITTDCGMCIMCHPETLDSVIAVLDAEHIVYEQTYLLKKRSYC